MSETATRLRKKYGIKEPSINYKDVARMFFGQGLGFRFGDEAIGTLRGYLDPDLTIDEAIAEERAERRRLEAEAAEAERLRIYNLPENVEKRRIEAELAEQRRQEQIRINEERRKERQRLAQIELERKAIEADRVLKEESMEFTFACANYGIPTFDASFAQNTWEVDFLVSIKKQMMKKKTLTSSQKTTLSQIVKRAMPTEKQLQYLKRILKHSIQQ